AAAKLYTRALRVAHELKIRYYLQCPKESLCICLSNRAAAHLMMGPHHVAAAYADCTAALEMIPGFPRAVQRMATCFLRLGYFRRATHCIESNRLECTSDSAKSMLLEIAEGKEGLDRARALLEDAEKTAEPNEAVSAAAEALQALEKARSVAPAAEYLVELEARVQLMVGNVEKARSLMEVPAVPVLGHLEELEEDDDVGTIADWRKAVEAQVVYGEGDLAQAVEMLQALTSSPSDERAMGAMATLLDCARQQLRVKKAGNLAFTMNKHDEARTLYTTALQVSHRPLSAYINAVCFCNRAAASHAMGSYADAVADCSRSLVLAPSYSKAWSRRGALYMEINDPAAAAVDLAEMVRILGTEEEGRSAGGNHEHLREARAREAEARALATSTPGPVVDYYKLFGVPWSATCGEIKKAYRQLALRHHPDKAAAVPGIGKAQRASMQAQAEQLFKLIGKASTVLGDGEQRAAYDRSVLGQTRRQSTHSSASSSSHFWQQWSDAFDERSKRRPSRDTSAEAGAGPRQWLQFRCQWLQLRRQWLQLRRVQYPDERKAKQRRGWRRKEQEK
ncbi:hypothetical protein CYMTET_15956, partial [Cymbomonas tetramitiformis]